MRQEKQIFHLPRLALMLILFLINQTSLTKTDNDKSMERFTDSESVSGSCHLGSESGRLQAFSSCFGDQPQVLLHPACLSL